MIHERFLREAGERYQATLAKFKEFDGAIRSIELPSLRFLLSDRDDEIPFEFLGKPYSMCLTCNLDSAKGMTCRIVLVSNGKETGFVHVNERGMVRDKPTSDWSTEIPSASQDIFAYLLVGPDPRAGFKAVHASSLA